MRSEGWSGGGRDEGSLPATLKNGPLQLRSTPAVVAALIAMAALGGGSIYLLERVSRTSITHFPKISSNLGDDFVPTPRENYMICYAIENRTAGHINLRFGGVNVVGHGDNSITRDIWVSDCASVTAIAAERLVVEKSSHFDGTSDVTVHKVRSRGSIDEAKPLVKEYGTGASYYIGANSGRHTTTGMWNVAFGEGALEHVITGVGNVAIGRSALNQLTGAKANVAIGVDSLRWNTTGYNNTAIGTASLWSNTTGYDNTAIGIRSLAFTTTGLNNTALGTDVFEENISGSRNSGFGAYAGRLGKKSSNNTVGGFSALYHYNGQLGQNTAMGVNALGFLTNGGNNTAVGVNSGLGARSAIDSEWFGLDAGNTPKQAPDVRNATAIGASSYTDADNQISLGNERVSEVRTWGSYTFKRGYPRDGADVKNGSLFMGEDGELYFKDGSGEVTRLSSGVRPVEASGP